MKVTAAQLDAMAAPLTKAKPVDPVVALGTPAVPAGDAAPAGRSGKAATTTKLTIRIDPDLQGRARAAFMASATTTGITSLSDWCAAAIEAAVVQTEASLNAGRPYVPLGTDIVPKGRLSHV